MCTTVVLKPIISNSRSVLWQHYHAEPIASQPEQCSENVSKIFTHKTQNWQHTWEKEREWVCVAQLSWTDERNCTALFAFSTRNFYLAKERHSHTNTEIVSGARLNVYVPVGDFWQPANQAGRTVYCQTNRYKVQIPVCRWKGEGEGGGWGKINDSIFERPSFGAGRSRMAAFDVRPSS